MTDIKTLAIAVTAAAGLLSAPGAVGGAGEMVTSDQLITALKPVVERGLAVAGSAAKSISLTTIQFAYDSDELTPAAKQQLDQLGAALNSAELRPYDFLLVGHTDGAGSQDYNQSLSERRASATLEYLVATSRVATVRLNSAGLGETVLINANDPADARNRRVEIFNMGDEEDETQRGGAGGARGGGVDAISPGVDVFCLAEGVSPTFHVAEAPEQATTLVVRRRTRPEQVLTAEWPAGATALHWADDWPPPEEGRYVWNLGYGGSSVFRIVPIEQPVASPLDAAAAYLRLDCDAQAKAAFKLAIAAANQD